MAWIRTVAGRLKSDYNYSGGVVYNNFPCPLPDESTRATHQRQAKKLLDARNLYPESFLADLYDDRVMPPELRKAHKENDASVCEAYVFPKNITEEEIVARLFVLYKKLTHL